MKRITDPAFRYYSSADTDLRRTFSRIRKQMREQKRQAKANTTIALIKRKEAR